MAGVADSEQGTDFDEVSVSRPWMSLFTPWKSQQARTIADVAEFLTKIRHSAKPSLVSSSYSSSFMINPVLCLEPTCTIASTRLLRMFASSMTDLKLLYHGRPFKASD